MNPTTSTRSYYPALDGLRGIAIILVICCHNLNFLPYFGLGWVGVDLFFVLSGFLITDILLQTRESKNFLQNFFIRRILRIFPLYYGVLLVFFVVAPMFQNLVAQFNYYNTDQPMSWLHLQNWLYITHEKPHDLLLLNHLWSLSVVDQFYLLWPFVVFVVMNTKYLEHIIYMVLVTCILARLSSWMIFGDDYTSFYFQSLTRLDGLCIGSLIALWRFNSLEGTRKKVMRLGLIVLSLHLALIIVARTFVPGFPHFRFIGYTSIAVLFGIVVFRVLEKTNFYSRFLLENSFIRYTGKISYGLYVYHWPILVLFKLYLLKRMIRYGYNYNAAYMVVSLIALATTVLVSMASYRFFEKPIMTLKYSMTSDGFFERMWQRLVSRFQSPTTEQEGSVNDEKV